jgi:hypothetical protein
MQALSIKAHSYLVTFLPGDTTYHIYRYIYRYILVHSYIYRYIYRYILVHS